MTHSAAISHFTAALPPSIQARPADDSSSGSSTNSSSTITSNDFLTLLVTEMKNQDPTNATDPNQYINQLVSVNSLQQLIQINETLSGALSSGSSPTSGKAAPPPSSSAQTSQPASMLQHAGMPPVTSGNLNLPPANASAERVALALASHPRG